MTQAGSSRGSTVAGLASGTEPSVQRYLYLRISGSTGYVTNSGSLVL
jgi:hypothetical protein